MNLQLRLTNQSGVQRLDALLRLGRRPAPVLQAMGVALFIITLENFHNPGNRPLPWPPKKRDGKPSHLYRTGRLFNSFQIRQTDTTVTVSNPVIYAATHQFGRDFGRGHPIPARPYFPVLHGQLIPAARERILAAARRAIEQETR